jgi:DNA-binding Lrp family transcriptional regulator
MPARVDRYEQRILALLQEDATLTAVATAEKVGLLRTL